MNRYNLFFYSCIKLQDDIWFSAANYNGLYRYDLEKKCTVKVADFPNENRMQSDLYHHVCLYNHSLIFIPFNTGIVSIYDIKQNSFKQIEIIPYPDKAVNTYLNFAGGTVYKDKLYIIGFAYPGIMKVDLKTYKTETVYKISEQPDKSAEWYLGMEIAVDNNFIYIPCCWQNYILAFDMDTDKVRQIKIGKESDRYIRVVKDKSLFYVMTSDFNRVIFWNRDKNSSREIEINSRKEESFICYNEKYVWLITNYAVKIADKTLKHICEVNFKQNMDIVYAAACGNGVYILDASTCDWYYIDSRGCIKGLNIRIEEPRSLKEVWHSFGLAEFVCESATAPIQYLICQVEDEKNIAFGGLAVEQTIGKSIWQTLSENY